MKLISWNVAGIRACIQKGLLDVFHELDADVFCMQEVKALKEQFEFSHDGYYEYLFPAKKKGYSGTLVYSKKEPISVSYGIGEEEYDDEGRIITLEYDDFFLVNVYVPNIKRDLSRMESRMYFEDAFRKYLCELDQEKCVVVCGDFNVAHEEIDIKNAKANRGNAGFTDEEREKFSVLLDSGFTDTYRYYHPEDIQYSWWSYMGHARENNVGWRIDYFICSNRFIDRISSAVIYDQIKGSDHCPIGIEIGE